VTFERDEGGIEAEINGKESQHRFKFHALKARKHICDASGNTLGKTTSPAVGRGSFWQMLFLALKDPY
jgi:hypothetical protein